MSEMISTIDRVLSELDAQNDRLDTFRGLAPAALALRPEPHRWSILEHIEHLSLTNRAYITSMQRCAQEGREAGRLARGPYEPSWFGRWFAKSMEPPVKRRIKTAGKITPAPDLNPDEVWIRFLAVQGELRDAAEASRGLDLARCKLRSPILPLIKLQLGATFDILLAHNRRHFWIADEQRDAAIRAAG